jgi:hypothetical protein
MRRFFFDVSTAKGFLYDYQGRSFRRDDEARQLAELIALDLELTEASKWTGSAVAVRNVHGKTLFSVDVEEPDLVAA